ncbi:MAG: glycosyltransferase [Prevotella sp.]|nr:glycosyltransferase [Prevotella sp.]
MKLSIITVNYNDAEGLERTIKSVITQTFRDFEFIIIDGGSTDNSIEVIRRYENAINYWVSEKDGGIYPGMNKGLRQAKGEYINFMNGGDSFHAPDVLERIFNLETNADIITGAHAGSPHPNVGENGVTLLDLYTGAVDHQASFIRREVALRHPYDERYRIVSDWKFFIEALVIDNCSFYYTSTVVVDVDMTGISNANSQLNRQEREAVLKELFSERIIKDYQLLASIHPSLLAVAPHISKSQRIRRVIVALAHQLLRLRGV